METWPPCSIGSGVQISPVEQSIHMVRGGVRSGTISASMLCSSARSGILLRTIFSLILVVAYHCATASGPQLLNVVNIGVFEHVADRHINPCARRRLTYALQKLC